MKRKKKVKGKKTEKSKITGSLKETLSLYSKLAELKKELTEISSMGTQTEDRLTDLEIHINLLTRLLTTLCVEKFGIRVGVLKRLIKRIETEAVRDSQIMELESLYNLAPKQNKKTPASPSKPKEDPWDQIS